VTGGYYSGSFGSTGDAITIICRTGYMCLAMLWGLFIAIIFPAGTVKYARDGQFASYFRFGEMFQFIKNHVSDYIVAILLSIVASIVAGIVGSIVCGVGLALTSFWSFLVMAHLFGQIEPTVAAPATTPGPTAPTYGELETTKLETPPSETPSNEPPTEL